MRFAYVDLGERAEGTRVVARLHGSHANVALLDKANFAQYRANLPFQYTGGMQRRTPVELTVPNDGHWFVVIDHGGFRGHVHGHIEVVQGEEVVQRDSVRVP